MGPRADGHCGEKNLGLAIAQQFNPWTVNVPTRLTECEICLLHQGMNTAYESLRITSGNPSLETSA